MSNIKYNNGDEYIGEVDKDGKKHGKGTYCWANGSKYEGDWLHGKKTGKGKYSWANGGFYEGEFLDGLFHGCGIESWVNGDVYEGQFKDGKQHGKGKFTNVDGDIFINTYENGVLIKSVPEEEENKVPIGADPFLQKFSSRRK